DVMSLIEKAREHIDEKQAIQLQKKMAGGSFDLEDFLQQMRQVKKMGSMTQLLEMIPGMSKALSQQDMREALEGDQLKTAEAIILSMTPAERHDPEIINGSRKRRIARGSGTTPQDVNQLLAQFRDAQKMMKQVMGLQKGMGGRGKMGRMMRQLGGMGGLGL
ncbi:MAG TPA: signal recognition particle protein, partial [Ktedonobacterales bacterium]|nr:signal recognition particle protein [Ktedonobacterales bacterium]